MNDRSETNSKEKVRKLVTLFFLIFFVALIGTTIWSVASLYTPGDDWWGGNTGVQITKYSILGAPLGALGLFMFLQLNKKDKKIIRTIQVGVIISAIVLSGLCIPYFTLPTTFGPTAKAEFAKTWGADWENRIKEPTQGPWIRTSYSVGTLYNGISYDDDSYTFTSNITFFSNENDTFMCDVYTPAGNGPNPILIYIHGGGWCGGDKDGKIGYQLEYFAAAGYSVFSVQYGAIAEKKMSRQYSMQEIMNNLAEFSNWLANSTNSQKYHADINRTFVTGLSAGGHLSALVSVARFNVTYWNPAVVLKGGVDYYGITDIRHWDVIDEQWLNKTGLFEVSVISNPTITDPFSPIAYVNSTQNDKSSIVPLLVFHGTVDGVVPVNQSTIFDAACDKNGVKCTYIEIPKADHVFEGHEESAVAQLTLWAMERFFQLCLL